MLTPNRMRVSLYKVILCKGWRSLFFLVSTGGGGASIGSQLQVTTPWSHTYTERGREREKKQETIERGRHKNEHDFNPIKTFSLFFSNEKKKIYIIIYFIPSRIYNIHFFLYQNLIFFFFLIQWRKIIFSSKSRYTFHVFIIIIYVNYKINILNKLTLVSYNNNIIITKFCRFSSNILENRREAYI